MTTAVWRCEPRSHGRNKPASPLPGRSPSVSVPHRSASPALCPCGNASSFRRRASSFVGRPVCKPPERGGRLPVCKAARGGQRRQCGVRARAWLAGRCASPPPSGGHGRPCAGYGSSRKSPQVALLFGKPAPAIEWMTALKQSYRLVLLRNQARAARKWPRKQPQTPPATRTHQGTWGVVAVLWGLLKNAKSRERRERRRRGRRRRTGPTAPTGPTGPTRTRTHHTHAHTHTRHHQGTWGVVAVIWGGSGAS